VLRFVDAVNEGLASSTVWLIVVARLVPAIHVFLVSKFKDVDARHKPGHTSLVRV
jgi:hypothetical protein